MSRERQKIARTIYVKVDTSVVHSPSKEKERSIRNITISAYLDKIVRANLAVNNTCFCDCQREFKNACRVKLSLSQNNGESSQIAV